MDNKKIVKISNIVGLVSISLLIYWVFIFISITVFGLKVFRENITESFYLSIVGILALMSGALMINIMFNLTKIAAHFDGEPAKSTGPRVKTSTWLIILSFPVIFGLLFLGNWYSSYKKEQYLVSSAKKMIHDYPAMIKELAEYRFDTNYIKKTENIISYLEKIDKNFPEIRIIRQDTIGANTNFLCFESGMEYVRINKTNFIFSCSARERDYLNSVYAGSHPTPKFEANGGNYELYYPVQAGKNTIILYFAERQRYGKIGS